MKKNFLISILLLSVTFVVSTHSYGQSNFTGNVNLIYGKKDIFSGDVFNKDMDENVEADLSKQKLMGFSADFGMKTWPVNIVVGLIKTNDIKSYKLVDSPNYWASRKLEGSTRELKIGVKRIEMPSKIIHPFVEAGLTYINAKLYDRGEITTDSELWAGEIVSETRRYDARYRREGLGLYFNGGVYVTIAHHFNLGIQAGVSRTKLEGEVSQEIGGFQGGLFLGYHW
jgi:hypothetical protein